MKGLHVLAYMADNDMDIQVAPFGTNFVEAEIQGSNGFITIGVPASVVRDIMLDKQFVGGLILASREQYEAVEKQAA